MSREEAMLFTLCLRIARQVLVALSFAALLPAAPAHAADPMKVGVGLSLTGGVAANGKQILMALEIPAAPTATKDGRLRLESGLRCAADHQRVAPADVRIPRRTVCVAA
jgi:hypothetical protein